MLDYTTSDSALLVALDRLQLKLAELEVGEDGYCVVRGRWRHQMHLLGAALVDRGWANMDVCDGYLRLRVNRAGANELGVFRALTSQAAERAREAGGQP